MSFKRKIVRRLVGWTDDWNSEIHQAIEERVLAEFERAFPLRVGSDLKQRDERISEMRSFYYTRMSITASLLMAGAAFVVALVALAVTVIPLFH
jgi:hypothetical protein